MIRANWSIAPVQQGEKPLMLFYQKHGKPEAVLLTAPDNRGKTMSSTARAGC